MPLGVEIPIANDNRNGKVECFHTTIILIVGCLSRKNSKGTATIFTISGPAADMHQKIWICLSDMSHLMDDLLHLPYKI